MDKQKLLKFANDYLEEKGLAVSPSTEKVLISKKYFNEKYLSEMDSEKAKQNIKILLDEVITKYEIRTSLSRQRTKIRDIDARPAIRKNFCKLPPFCE